MLEQRKLRVAAYIRVSTQYENQEESYENQKRYFTKMLEERPDWIFSGIYSDYGCSATSGEKRSGFQRILRHCAEGKIDRIICKSISRFARNTGDFLMALQVLREHNVTILFEKENMDTGRLFSEFILTTLGAIAQEESRSISENIRWGFRKRYPRGEAPNIPIFGYRYSTEIRMASGYKLRQVEIVEKEAAVIRKIYALGTTGESFAGIARQLNREGIEAPKKAKCGWTGAAVGRILRLERYCGDVKLQKTYKKDYLSHQVYRNRGELPQYLVFDHHPAIVSRQLYEEVQKRHPQRQRRDAGTGSTNQRYPYSGRIVCSHCGRFYHTRNRKSHPIWYCPSSALHNGKTVCQVRWIYEDEIRALLVRAFHKRFQTWEAVHSALLRVQERDMMEAEGIYEERGRILRSSDYSYYLRCAVWESVPAFIQEIRIDGSGKCEVVWFDQSKTREYWEAVL